MEMSPARLATGAELKKLVTHQPSCACTHNTLAARGLEEPCASFPDFCDNHQFHIIYCVYSRLCKVLFFEEFLIHESHGFMILKNN
jgi:hypothetical protein